MASKETLTGEQNSTLAKHLMGALFATEGAMYHGVRASIPLDVEQNVKLTSDGETHGQAIGRLIDVLIEQGFDGTVTLGDGSHIHTHLYINFAQMQNLDRGEHYGENV